MPIHQGESKFSLSARKNGHTCLRIVVCKVFRFQPPPWILDPTPIPSSFCWWLNHTPLSFSALLHLFGPARKFHQLQTKPFHNSVVAKHAFGLPSSFWKRVLTQQKWFMFSHTPFREETTFLDQRSQKVAFFTRSNFVECENPLLCQRLRCQNRRTQNAAHSLMHPVNFIEASEYFGPPWRISVAQRDQFKLI